MKILEIRIKDSTGLERILPEAELKAGAGIAGDQHKDRPGRDLSMLDFQTAQRILDKHGLCTDRFIANIVLRKTAGAEPGKIYKAGEAEIQITQKGKKCFPECPLAAAGDPCGLAENVLFADVISAGVIRPGDSLQEKYK